MAGTSDRVVFRPRRLIAFSTTACVILVLMAIGGWFALPASLRALFLFSQVVTLIIILGLMVLGVGIIASSNVTADPSGIRIRNGLGVHRVAWTRVHKFLLRPGDPWGIVLITPEDRPFEVDLDAEKFQLMGIQAGDGPRAREAVAELTAMQRRFGGSPSMPARPAD